MIYQILSIHLFYQRQDTFPLGPGSGYIHDLYVKNNIVYAFHGYFGLYKWDFSNPLSPVLIGGVITGDDNHSSWIASDTNFIVYAEEIMGGRPLGVIDMSDPNDFNIVNTFKNPLLAPLHTTVRPHNPYIIGDFLYVSYYLDGVQIWNIKDLMSLSGNGRKSLAFRRRL